MVSNSIMSESNGGSYYFEQQDVISDVHLADNRNILIQKLKMLATLIKFMAHLQIV